MEAEKNVQRNRLAYQKLQAEKGALAATEGADFMLETKTANEAKRIVAEGEINSIGALQTGLGSALRSGNSAQIRAYTDALAGKGKNGREAIRNAYDGNINSITPAAARTFADNIIGKNGATFKSKDRTMYDLASEINKNITNNKGSYSMPESYSLSTTSSYASAHKQELLKELSSSLLGSMDTTAIKDLFNSKDGVNLSMPTGNPNLNQQIGAAAYEALSSGTVKDVDRQSLLQAIYDQSGYRPSAQNVNVVNPVTTQTPPPPGYGDGSNYEQSSSGLWIPKK